MTNELPSNPKHFQSEPDNILELDISSTKNLQIGYHAETVFLLPSESSLLVIKEYIGGLSGTEYYAKVNANRFKTTIRYGRREEVNRETFVEVFLPENWHGELSLSSQYGHITTEHDWEFERFAAETNEGAITLKSMKAPRIHLVSPVKGIRLEKAEGFADLHSVSGSILARHILGGGKLATSGGSIFAAFSSLNTIVECNTLNGDIEIALPDSQGMKIDGITKIGEIDAKPEGLTLKIKPGNVKNITGILGEKPFQDVRISTINGNILLR